MSTKVLMHFLKAAKGKKEGAKGMSGEEQLPGKQ